MMRFDLYGMVHKGIRATLFETASLAARSDFRRDDDAAGAAAAVHRLLGFLEGHAAGEDAVVMPELARLAPEVFAELGAEHARLQGLQAEIGRMAERLEGASAAARVSLGYRLHGRLCRLVAEHVTHMEREETEANRVLWAHHADEELWALHDRIVAGIPPERMAAGLAVLLPAMSLPERAAMVAKLHAAFPPPGFGALIGPARAALGSEGWASVTAAAGI